MKLTRQRQKAPSPQLNMTPMIDCVFQLLIFFLCTSSFTTEQHLQTQLPAASKEKPAQEPLPPVRIAVSRVGDDVLMACDDQACGTFDTLVERLKARRAIAPAPADREKDPLHVIIEGQAGVPFAFMAGALDACHQADLFSVAFSPKGIGP